MTSWGPNPPSATCPWIFSGRGEPPPPSSPTCTPNIAANPPRRPSSIPHIPATRGLTLMPTKCLTAIWPRMTIPYLPIRGWESCPNALIMTLAILTRRGRGMSRNQNWLEFKVRWVICRNWRRYLNSQDKIPIPILRSRKRKERWTKAWTCSLKWGWADRIQRPTHQGKVHSKGKI